MTIYPGGCRCGNVAVAFETGVAPETMQVRECQCSFCLSHGAAYTTDPRGSVTIRILDKSKVNRYEFTGLEKSAGFLCCTECGVYVGAVADSEGRTFAAINIRWIPDLAGRITAAIPMDYSAESKEDSRQRQLAKWTPAAIEA